MVLHFFPPFTHIQQLLFYFQDPRVSALKLQASPPHFGGPLQRDRVKETCVVQAPNSSQGRARIKSINYCSQTQCECSPPCNPPMSFKRDKQGQGELFTSRMYLSVLLLVSVFKYVWSLILFCPALVQLVCLCHLCEPCTEKHGIKTCNHKSGQNLKACISECQKNEANVII